MIKTIEELTRDIIAFRAKHYDNINKRWKAETGEYCNVEETKIYQAQYRQMRFSIQMLEEEEKVSLFYDTHSGAGNGEEIKKLMPLVSRRNNSPLWEKIGKVLQDGSLFTFNVETWDVLAICNCTEEQLNQQLIDEKATIEQLTGFKDGTLDHLRQQHSLRLQKVHNTGADCPNPKIENYETFQKKHTIGNWNCRGCLNVGTEISNVEQANAAMAVGAKALDWCPRFIPLLRTRKFDEYIQMVTATHDNKVCYAGLVHTEMDFDESLLCGCTDDQLTEEHIGGRATDKDRADLREQHCKFLNTPGVYSTHCDHPSHKHYVVITKKCDTCNYTDVERKEYHIPEQVQSNELLMKFPGV